MPKLLIAAGGTGGHLFPAQALAQELLSKNPKLELVFAGHGLSNSRYFNAEAFSYFDVASGTPFRASGLFSLLKIAAGTKKALKILKEFQPDLLVGFGSFHSFPLLLAAFMRGIPFLLFEANAAPGKVNRLFSKWAQVTALQFPHAAGKLRGKTLEVAMPMGERQKKFAIDKKAARLFFGLHPERFTFLVFGGSQGALSLNKIFCEAATFLGKILPEFQVIHLTGHKKDTEKVKNTYSLLNISACVKEFEQEMPIAWKAADFAIVRAGAATLSEQIIAEVPALLIPYPFASDDHQRKNAEVMEKEVRGARILLESELNAESLLNSVQECVQEEALLAMQASLRNFHVGQQKCTLSDLIHEILKEKK